MLIFNENACVLSRATEIGMQKTSFTLATKVSGEANQHFYSVL